MFVVLTILALVTIIQSMFGVGILVFGTPALLMFGNSFTQTLSILLPCSIAVSLLQVLEAKTGEISIRRDFFIYAVPIIFVSLVAVVSGIVQIDLKLLVAIVLIVTGLLRLCRISYNNQTKHEINGGVWPSHYRMIHI